ncbi:unnamed protein product [Meloidogyne enterolobii]|uniref:Uncharacterized protein n=2 Tax=Meloidogyne enterolobii TaxID=390850 RepID=A0ACB0YZ88_MELEN|nr:unnamed protein product [Meloidogyne enterolobii]
MDGDSPAYRFLGRNINSKIDIINFSPAKKITQNNPLGEIDEEKKRRVKEKHFENNDLVWVRDHSGSGNWREGKVIGKNGDYIYQVKLENGKTSNAHTDQLRVRKSGLRNSASF